MPALEILIMLPTGGLQRAVLEMEAGSSVQQALQASGLLATYPDLLERPMGLFSKPVQLDTPLKPGDRLEIYQALLVDPKDKRRLLARRLKKAAKAAQIPRRKRQRSQDKGIS